MSRFAQIDLSSLPSPAAIEQLNFDSIKASMISDLMARDPSFTALLESDPAIAVLEACAYREMLLRQRINDSVKARMLATAQGADLDNLAAELGTARLSVTDLLGNVTYETDDRLRMRTQLALEAFSTCGPIGAYLYQAFSVSMDIADVSVFMSAPGTVMVIILATPAASTDGLGTPAQTLIDKVVAQLNADEIRPLTDVIEVRAVTIVHYSVNAALTLFYGPDSETVRSAAVAAVQQYEQRCNRIGYDVTLPGIYAALQQIGVETSAITAPTQDVVIDDTQVAICDSITITVQGRNQ